MLVFILVSNSSNALFKFNTHTHKELIEHLYPTGVVGWTWSPCFIDWSPLPNRCGGMDLTFLLFRLAKTHLFRPIYSQYKFHFDAAKFKVAYLEFQYFWYLSQVCEFRICIPLVLQPWGACIRSVKCMYQTHLILC